MLRTKVTEEKMYYGLTLDSLVPQDHFLRLVDKHIDFDFIYSKVKKLYSHTGKPSIDPVVLIKMVLIGYLYNIKSERQLEKEIQVNLAYRWFIRYTLDETIPDHSTISQTRRRKFKGSGIFEELFENIVEQCIKFGFVKGETILTDATHIKASASMDSLREVTITPIDYLKQLDESIDGKSENEEHSDGDSLKKHGKEHHYSNKTHRSTTDPDSRLVPSTSKRSGGLYYKEHRSIDSSGYITDVHITHGNVTDSAPYLERLDYQRFRFKFPIHDVVADRGYGKNHIYKGLSDRRISAFIPSIVESRSDFERFFKKHFAYNYENDEYTCPAGHVLRKKRTVPRKRDDCYEYAARRTFCNAHCEFREQCTKGSERSIRVVQRHMYQNYTDEQLSKRGSVKWRKLINLRKTIVEGSFGDAKTNHGLGRAKMRGFEGIREQSFMTAIAQNIKKLVKEIKKGGMGEAILSFRVLIQEYFAAEFVF